MNRRLSRESLEHSETPRVAGHGGLPEGEFALTCEIEKELGAMQNALLSRNLGGLEQATRELARCFAALKQVAGVSQGSKPPSEPRTALAPAVPQPLRDVQMRVLYLGRVQAALLARAQRSLSMLRNLLGESDATYAPPPVNRSLHPIREASTGDCRCRA